MMGEAQWPRRKVTVCLKTGIGWLRMLISYCITSHNCLTMSDTKGLKEFAVENTWIKRRLVEQRLMQKQLYFAQIPIIICSSKWEVIGSRR